MTYAFTFDASACTGCKACQVACKDKNNLPEGVLWRRVYEVSGGSWQKQGEAWQTDVFAYNLSIACNHCVHPKCAGVCPTDAYVQREDGIVYINESKCMGCGYCSWACPYSAPRYHPELRHMTKCNFCMDELDQGRPPACVAACPMRVLDYTVISDQASSISAGHLQLWETPGLEHPFPLPTFSRTQPHVALRPHPAMQNDLEKRIANREEIRPAERALGEWPLVAFTLLGQMAAGMAVFALFLPFSFFTQIAIGFLLGLAGVASLLHLGAPQNAWRALNHLKKSWLSREILAFGLFGAAWLVSLAQHWSLNTDDCSLLTALTGLWLVYSMSQVYHLRTVPAWNTWRTEAAFFLSSGTLGTLAMAVLTDEIALAITALPFLAGEAVLILLGGEKAHSTVNRLRLSLSAGGAAGVCLIAQWSESAAAWIMLPIFLIVCLQESLGRVQFYALRDVKQKLP